VVSSLFATLISDYLSDGLKALFPASRNQGIELLAILLSRELVV